MAQNYFNSNIKDCWPQITMINMIIMEKIEILRELPNCDIETWNEKMLLEK